MAVICPKCSKNIDFSGESTPSEGVVTRCPQCGSILKIIGDYAYIPTEKVTLDNVSEEREPEQEPTHPLFNEAVELIKTCNAISTPTLQSFFNISADEAAKLMTELEQKGIVGPYNNGAPRKILIEHNTSLVYIHRKKSSDDTLSDTQDEPTDATRSYGCTINLGGCLTVITIILIIYLIYNILQYIIDK